MAKTHIYALHDPRDWSIRYIGKANDPNRRMQGHFRRPKGTAMRRFVSELRALGLSLRVSVLQSCSQEQWQQWERFWIATARASGEKLLNIAEGGNAPSTTRESCRLARLGKKDSPEVRLKKSLSAKGKAKSPEHIRNAGMAQRGRKFSPEHREKLRIAKLGTKRPPEFGAKHTSTMREKWNDPAYREKVSSGLRDSWRKRKEMMEV